MPEDHSRASRAKPPPRAATRPRKTGGGAVGCGTSRSKKGRPGSAWTSIWSGASAMCRGRRIFRIIRRGEVRVNGRRVGPEARLSANDKVRVPPLWEQAEQGAARVQRGPPSGLVEAVGRAIVQEDGPAAGPGQAGRDCRPWRQRHQLRGHRSAAGAQARRAARAGAPPGSRHQRLPAGGSRCGDAADRACAAAGRPVREALPGRWSRASGTSARSGSTSRCEPIPGWAASAPCARTPRAKPSLSDFRPVQFFGKLATLMEVGLHTGRTHQIRVHATYAGHPVAGDEKYGDAEFNARMRELGADEDVPARPQHELRVASGRDVQCQRTAPAGACRRSRRLAAERPRLKASCEAGAAQRAGQPDERQADEGGRVAALDAFEERDAQAFRA